VDFEVYPEFLSEDTNITQVQRSRTQDKMQPVSCGLENHYNDCVLTSHCVRSISNNHFLSYAKFPLKLLKYSIHGQNSR